MIRKRPDGKFIRPRAYTRSAPSPGIASLSSSTLIIELQRTSVKYIFGHCFTSTVTASSRQDRAESEVEHAERVVKEGFKKLRWKQADLPGTRKEDHRKVKLAL